MAVSLRELANPNLVYRPADLTTLFPEDWNELRKATTLGTQGLNPSHLDIAGSTCITAARAATLTELLPDADNTRSCGSAVKRWLNGYFTNLFGVGTGLTGVLLLTGGTMSGDIDMGTNSITNLADGVSGTDAVNFDQLSAYAGDGDSYKYQCRVATTEDVDLTAALVTVDGVGLVENDRILVWQQLDPIENGIYAESSGGALSRTSDFDADSEAEAAFVHIREGALYGGAAFAMSGDFPSSIGVTDIDFTRITAQPSIVRQSKTADYVIATPLGENGTTFDNLGAGAAVDFELPSAAAGYLFGFRRIASHDVTITAAAGDTITLGDVTTAGGGTITLQSDGSAVTLESVDATEWYVTALAGSAEA